MKKLIIAGMLIITALMINSCGKDDSPGDTIVVYKVPVEISARYIALAFANASAGINTHLEKMAALAAQGYGNFDSTFTLKNLDSSAVVKYQYSVQYNYARLTTTPPKITLDYSTIGWFRSDGLQSQDQQLGSWEVSTLDQSQLTFNGSGSDGGSQYAPLEMVGFSSHINYTLKNLLMDKLTYKAVSGSAEITINGTGPAGVLFNYSGALTFSGNRLAVLELGGLAFNINLSSGLITK